MQIINDIFPNTDPLYPLEEFCRKEKALYIDIETTGLSKESTSLYLIGCGYYKGNDFYTKLFFADDPSEELPLMRSFLDFSTEFTHIIHFNGSKFDIPYLSYKAKKYDLGNIFENFEQIDVYQLCKPLRYLLFPVSMRQKCIEDFMGITRDDKFNGGELISVYNSYVKSKNPEDFDPLITHNKEDVIGMHKILPILHFLRLKDSHLSYVSYTVNIYKDYLGTDQKEIILKYKSDIFFPKSFSAKTETMYLHANNESGIFTFRLPIYNTEMKYFFDNYKDYYYLLNEDCCIHKSFAMGLDKKSYKKASRDTCYQRISSDFIKQPDRIFSPVCRKDYKDKALFFRFPESFTRDKADEFGEKLLSVFFNMKKTSK